MIRPVSLVEWRGESRDACQLFGFAVPQVLFPDSVLVSVCDDDLDASPSVAVPVDRTADVDLDDVEAVVQLPYQVGIVVREHELRPDFVEAAELGGERPVLLLGEALLRIRLERRRVQRGVWGVDEAEVPRLDAGEGIEEVTVRDGGGPQRFRVGLDDLLGERPALRAVERDVEQPLAVDSVQPIEAVAVEE